MLYTVKRIHGVRIKWNLRISLTDLLALYCKVLDKPTDQIHSKINGLKGFILK